MILKSKINLLQPALRRFSNWIFFVANLDVLCGINEGLTPHADQDFVEFSHNFESLARFRGLIVGPLPHSSIGKDAVSAFKLTVSRAI